MAGKAAVRKRVSEKFKIELVEMALRKIHKQLESEGDIKATLGDLIRLMEAHSAMKQGAAPSEVLVQWVNNEAPEPHANG